MKPVFLITPVENDRPTVSLLTEPPAQVPDGALVRELKLSADGAKLLNRIWDMKPDLKPVLSALCLAGWVIRHRPEEPATVHGAWYAQIRTATVGLESAGFIYMHQPGIALALMESGTVVRGTCEVIVGEADTYAFRTLTVPLQTMPPKQTREITALVNDCLLAGWQP
ncbi:MAG: hypothetical protein KBC95_01465 [Candidatus Peribacteraceae bacterium]|nr:hypothetical protein [Candidatus Peribacteraceae bacterium]